MSKFHLVSNRESVFIDGRQYLWDAQLGLDTNWPALVMLAGKSCDLAEQTG